MRVKQTVGVKQTLGVVALPLLLALPTQAAPLRLTYEGTLDGVKILTTQADLTTDAAGYLVHAQIALVGGASLLVHGHSEVISQGIWQGAAAHPTHLDSESYWNGRPGRLIVDFPNGIPRVVLLQPPDPRKLKALAPATLAGTIDGLGLIAALIHQIAITGHCTTHARLFDGHGVTAFDMDTHTPQQAGPLRCDFTTRKVAGLLPDDNPHRVDHGYVLFSAATPTLPILPEQVVLNGGWLGQPRLTLVAAGEQ